MIILRLGNWNKTTHFHHITHNRLSLPPHPDQNNDQTAIKKRKETRRWHDNVEPLDKVTSLLEPGDLGPCRPWALVNNLIMKSGSSVSLSNIIWSFIDWVSHLPIHWVGTICRCVRSLSGNVAMYVLPIKVITKTQSDVTQHSQYYHLLTTPDHQKTSQLLPVPVPHPSAVSSQ